MTYGKEIASALKWGFIIIVAAVAYHMVAPKYYFMKGGDLRGNRITGKIEMLDSHGWVDVSGE